MSHTEGLLQKAERYIRSAELLANDGDFDSAISRLYYAMFYVAEALLAMRGLAFSSHQGVINAFGTQFAKTGELDASHHRALINAFNRRQLSEYSLLSGVTRQDVDDMTEMAK